MPTNNQLTCQMLDFAAVSFEYLKAKSETESCRNEYRHVRDKYLRGISPEKRKEFRDVVKLKGFQKATGKQYQAYLDAKANEYNVKRRLDTRFRKMPGDTVGIIRFVIAAIGGAV